jgi:diguanylate cyclase
MRPANSPHAGRRPNLGKRSTYRRIGSGALSGWADVRMPPGWIVLLAAAPVLIATYLFLPTAGSARTVAYPAFGLIATVAILVAISTRHPSRPGAWRLVAGALALLSLGDVTYTVLALGGEVGYPSLADLAYLAGYAALISGVVGLVRGRVAGGERSAIIDATILSLGVLSLFWIAILRPSLAESVNYLAAFVSLSYPAMDILLLTVCVRVLMSAGSRSRYLQLLVAGITLYFIADVIYAMLLLHGAYTEGNLVDAGWIAGVLLIGVAALHPSVGESVVPAPNAEARLSGRRLAMLAASALTAPTILLIWEARAGDELALGLVVVWTALFALVFLRLATTVKALARSLRDRHRLQRTLLHQANHDPLTGLASRLRFDAQLAGAMHHSPHRTGLVFLDLDDFKGINDSLGHPSGDEVLRIVAARVRKSLRRGDLAARMGGDELAILAVDCAHLATVRSVAERALTAVRTPIKVAGRQLKVHASAGVTIGQHNSTGINLMRDADIALYEAKVKGKDHVEDFTPSMLGNAVRAYALRTELSTALDTNSFVLHYQPEVDLRTGDIIGAEALVRWNHPERGLVSPLEFIPEAEASGLIHPLGRWILREACATAAAWPRSHLEQRPSVSVNLSASQLLQPGVVREVARTLAETGLAARDLCLEVTEGALLDIVPARAALLGLHDLGVSLALDDFGTGYSALNLLAELPFDIVKIDQSFMHGLGQGGRMDALLRGIIALCKSLSLATLAEGIERESQLSELRRMGCQIGQGYLFGRPTPGAALEALLIAKTPGEGPRSVSPATNGRARVDVRVAV